MTDPDEYTGTLNEQIAANAAAIKAIQEQITKDGTACKAAIAALGKRADKLEADAKAADTQTKALEGKVADHENTTKAATETLEKTLKAGLAALVKRIKDLEDKVGLQATGVGPADASTHEHPWTPDGAWPPGDLAALQAANIKPAAKFGAGEFVTLGDGSKANWDGGKWVAGAAK